MSRKGSDESSVTVAEAGSLGGKARSSRLSKERISEISRHASNARWSKFRNRLKPKSAALDDPGTTVQRGRPKAKKKTGADQLNHELDLKRQAKRREPASA